MSGTEAATLCGIRGGTARERRGKMPPAGLIVGLLVLSLGATGCSAARRLYASEGFNEFGQRYNYYPAEQGREDALVFAKSLL